MNRMIRTVLALGAVWLSVSGFSGSTVQAAQDCTVTFRAGNVGSFDVKKVESSIKDEKLVSVQPEYIKIKAAKGQSMETALYAAFGRAVTGAGDFNALFLGFLKENPDYTMREESSWGPEASQIIRRSGEYVLDYGVLVDPVAYRISYVDEESGDAVATPVMNYGNDGDIVNCAPVTVSGYEALEDPVVLTLGKDRENTVTFSYRYTGETYVPGTVTYRTEYEDAAGMEEETKNPAQDRDSTRDVAGQTDQISPQDVTGQTGETSPQDMAGQQKADGDQNTVGQEIAEENVPLAAGEENRTMEEESIPLAAGQKQADVWMLGGIAVTAGVAAAVLIATGIVVKRRRRGR